MKICMKNYRPAPVFEQGDVVEFTTNYTFYSITVGRRVGYSRGDLAVVGLPMEIYRNDYDLSLTRLSDGRTIAHNTSRCGISSSIRKVDGCFTVGGTS